MDDDAMAAVVAEVYQQGRRDGAAKQEKNYDAGYAMARKVEYDRGFEAGAASVERLNADDRDFAWASGWGPRGAYRGKKSTWERICGGQTH